MRWMLCLGFALLPAACGPPMPDEENSASDPRNDMSPRFPTPGSTHAHILFLNFDGATVGPGAADDAAQNRSELVAHAVVVPPLDAAGLGRDGVDARADIATQVARLFAAYDFQVTAARPAGDARYSMAIVGGFPEAIDAPTATRGYAPLDCQDGNPGDVVFVFAAALQGDYAGDPVTARRAIAQVIAQESAHGFGLCHTDNPSDIMYPYVGHPLEEQRFASGFALGLRCGSEAFQDSADRLLELLGPAG